MKITSEQWLGGMHLQEQKLENSVASVDTGVLVAGIALAGSYICYGLLRIAEAIEGRSSDAN